MAVADSCGDVKRPAVGGPLRGEEGRALGPLGRGVPVGDVSGGAASGAVVVIASVVVRGEAWRAETGAEVVGAGAGERSVDELVDEALQSLVDRVGLLLREPLVRDGLVESRPGAVEDRLLEAVDRLALGLGDLRERLAVTELLEQLAPR